MHAAFIPYGLKSAVDKLANEMQCQKFYIPFWKGEDKKSILMEAQLRLAPFGVWEFVFPKEYKDVVLTTLKFNQDIPYGLSTQIFFLRKVLKLKKARPKDTSNKLSWLMQDVSIIPLGIREDGELTEINGDWPGYTHERI